jgi:AcrR family transcriptional regulator
VPRLWTKTIETHRHQVRDAILLSAAALVGERGALSVTMSEVAERAGIGRATLYKYFTDVEAILLAWHEQRISGHLEYLSDVRDRAGNSDQKLAAVLEAYAFIDYEHHGSEEHRSHLQDPALMALLHRGGHVMRARRELQEMVRELIDDAAAETGDIRDDVSSAELASYCLNALSGASSLPSKAAVRRLVNLTLSGLRASERTR